MTLSLLAMLEFGNPAMLLFALAGLAPIVLHWLSRRRHEEVAWAAMQFLLSALHRSSRRIRLEQILLMATRIGLLLLLALAVADPRQSSDLPASSVAKRGPRHLVIVLDGTYSMATQHQGKTRLDRARKIAADLVRSSQVGDRFSLLLLADPPQIVVGNPTAAHAPMLLEIDRLQPPHGGSDLSATLDAARHQIELGSKNFPDLQEAHVFFITDLGQSTWDSLAEGKIDKQLRRLTRIAEVRLLLADDGDVADRGNLAVTALRAESQLLSMQNDATFIATVHNFGIEKIERGRAELLVDGKPVEEQRFDIDARGDRSISFAHRFQQPGPHAVACRLEDDPLLLDNSRYLVVDVHRVVRVVCVGGSPADTFFIERALAPGDASQQKIDVATVAPYRLPDLAWDDVTCVVLSNMPSIAPESAAALREYIEKGGGMIAFLGDRLEQANANPSWLDEMWSHDSNPLTLLESISPGHPLRFDPRDYQHRLVQSFRGNEQAGLLSVPTWKYHRMEWSEPSQVALWFNSGDPAIVESPSGDGIILVVATAASDASVDQSDDETIPWTMLPLSPCFPPLVQKMVEQAAGGRSNARQGLVGDPLSGRLKKGLNESAIAVTLIRSPDESLVGVEQTIHPEWEESTQRWSLPATTFAGVYSARGEINQEGLQLDAINLNLALGESESTRLQIANLPESLWPTETGTRPSASPDLSGQHKYFIHFLIGVVMLIVVESLLTWSMGRQSAEMSDGV